MPQRLEAALRAHYPGRHFDVLNRGAGGEEAPDQLRRMQRDVIDERPSVVIWQVGSNAVWKKQDLDATARAIREGIAMLAEAFVDIVLMDIQFAPRLLTPDKIAGARRMVNLIEQAAAGATVPVNVFKRFELMRAWHEVEKISFDRMLNPGDFDRAAPQRLERQPHGVAVEGLRWRPLQRRPRRAADAWPDFSQFDAASFRDASMSKP